MFRRRVYTFPAGDPMISAQMESLATRIFWKLPMICIQVSASTIRVRDAFSIVNFVLPSLPEILPIARERCSPLRVCTCNRCIRWQMHAVAHAVNISQLRCNLLCRKQGVHACSPSHGTNKPRDGACLHIFDFKCLNVQIVHAHERQSILQIEAYRHTMTVSCVH